MARTWAKRILVGSAVAWLVFAGTVLGRYADEAVPTSFLVRPLVVVTLLALLIGTMSSLAGRWSAAVAATLAVAIALYPLGLLALLVLVVSVAVEFVAWTRDRRWPIALTWQKIVLTLSAVFFGISAVRAAAFIDPIPGLTEQARADSTLAAQGPSLYLVMLDGYPRSDTLATELGIDNGAFLDELAERGFDVYGDAHSPRGHTELTLAALLNASEAGVPDEAASVQEQRQARQRLNEARLPHIAMDAGYDFVVIDSPIGHVSFTTGRHIRHDGVTNFESGLVAETLLSQIVVGNAPQLLTSSLRAHLDDSLASLVDLATPDRSSVVFAHLMTPHLPALYAADGSPLPIPAYYPLHQLFGSVIEDVDISLDDYKALYAGNLATINRKILATVDGMLAANPEAVIVLFSDHGARYSFDVPDEWHRSFLAAHTPGHADLFGESPSATDLLCDLYVAYLDLPCQ